MALIIGVGHGHFTDPFTCSTSSEDTDDLGKVEDCLERLRAHQFPDVNIETVRTWIDEILVVEDDDVLHAYSWEDGLGEQLPEAEEELEELPVDNLPDFDKDDSDSEDA